MAGAAAPPTALDAQVRELGARLRGPRRLRADLLREARAGLEDAAEAHQRRGLGAVQAQRLAVVEFGALDEVAEDFQERLVVAQGRATARLVLATFPGLLLAWDVLGAAGTGWSQVSPGVVALARAVDVVSLGTGVAALGALVLLAQRDRRPGGSRRTVAAVGVLGAASAVVCGAASVVMSTAAGGASQLGAPQPLVLAAYAVSAAAMAVVLGSVARSLRLVARSG